MRDALDGVFGYAFDEIEFRRIEADVDPRNLSSIRILESLDFKKESYLHERWLTAEETQDSLFYGLLKKEWVGSSTYKVLPASAPQSSFLKELRSKLTG